MIYIIYVSITYSCLRFITPTLIILKDDPPTPFCFFSLFKKIKCEYAAGHGIAHQQNVFTKQNTKTDGFCFFFLKVVSRAPEKHLELFAGLDEK